MRALILFAAMFALLPACSTSDQCDSGQRCRISTDAGCQLFLPVCCVAEPPMCDVGLTMVTGSQPGCEDMGTVGSVTCK
jgi:hypothetical protein